MLQRRSLIAGLLVTPAIVRYNSLMKLAPVRWYAKPVISATWGLGWVRVSEAAADRWDRDLATIAVNGPRLPRWPISPRIGVIWTDNSLQAQTLFRGNGPWDYPAFAERATWLVHDARRPRTAGETGTQRTANPP